MSSSQWSFPRTSYFHLQLWTPTWLTLLSFASYSTVTLTLLHPSGLPSNYLSVSVCLPRHLPTPVFLGFPCGSAGSESTCNAGDLGLIPGLGRFPRRMERLLIPVFWPGEFHRLYSQWGRKESETAEWLSFSLPRYRIVDISHLWSSYSNSPHWNINSIKTRMFVYCIHYYTSVPK